jgi:hypothetical protein
MCRAPTHCSSHHSTKRLNPIQPPQLVPAPPILTTAPAPRVPELPAALPPRVAPALRVNKLPGAPPPRVAPNTPIPPMVPPAPVTNTAPDPPTIPYLTWAQQAAIAHPSPTLLKTPVAPIAGRIVFFNPKTEQIRHWTQYDPPLNPPAPLAHVVFNPSTGATLNYHLLLRGPEGPLWRQGTSNF